MADSCKRYSKGQLAWGNARYAYVSLSCLSERDRARVRASYPYKDIAPDSAYLYPVKQDGSLAKNASRASLPLPQFKKLVYKR